MLLLHASSPFFEDSCVWSVKCSLIKFMLLTEIIYSYLLLWERYISVAWQHEFVRLNDICYSKFAVRSVSSLQRMLVTKWWICRHLLIDILPPRSEIFVFSFFLSTWFLTLSLRNRKYSGDKGVSFSHLISIKARLYLFMYGFTYRYLVFSCSIKDLLHTIE